MNQKTKWLIRDIGLPFLNSDLENVDYNNYNNLNLYKAYFAVEKIPLLLHLSIRLKQLTWPVNCSGLRKV